MSECASDLTVNSRIRLPQLPSWLLVAGCTLLVGLVFMTDEHRWDRSALKDYVESAQERAAAAVSGNKMRRIAFFALGCSGAVLMLSGSKLPALREPMGLCLLIATAWTLAA